MVKIQKRDLFSIVFALIVTLIFISLKYDVGIIGFITSMRTRFWNEFFLGFAFISSSAVIFLFLTVLFLWNENKRRWILPLWVTSFLSVIVGFLLKVLVQRPRPFEAGIDVSVITQIAESVGSWWNYSFPSFRTMLVFAALPILQKEFKKFKYIWLIFAVLVGFSRLYFGVHFLSDVLSGAIIGYIIGLFVIKTEQDKEFGKKINKWLYKKRKGI